MDIPAKNGCNIRPVYFFEDGFCRLHGLNVDEYISVAYIPG
jgi:hypothetical protein